MFEQPEVTGPEPLRRRVRNALGATMLFVVLTVKSFQAHGWNWAMLVPPLALLLVFGPILIGQRLGRRR